MSLLRIVGSAEDFHESVMEIRRSGLELSVHRGAITMHRLSAVKMAARARRDGGSLREAARTVGVSLSTIWRWCQAYGHYGVAGLVPLKPTGRPKKGRAAGTVAASRRDAQRSASDGRPYTTERRG